MLDGSQTLLPADELKKKFEKEGISLDKPIVTSCGTGVAACVLALVLDHLDSWSKAHKEAAQFCQNILQKKLIDWEPVLRNDLSHPIQNVDLVVTIGGDGTLLHASHFLDSSVPVLGVNSDPTRADEVEESNDEFDAIRSTGYLCAATIQNFEIVLDDILEGRTRPSNVSRMEMRINSQPLSTYALNDILIAHPCPASVSRFSFKTVTDRNQISPLVNCRSSGMRVSTAAGSTAAMLSSGGYAMRISSRDLQYLVREPISPPVSTESLLHGIVKADQTMDIQWFCDKGLVYIDGAHVLHPVQHGDTINVSSHAPVLKAFLPRHFFHLP